MERRVPRWAQRLYRFMRRENLHRVLLLLGALSLASAIFLWSLEPDKPLADWLWWSVVTITTVGYGDITPTTVFGRLTGVVLMFFGIGVLSTFTATIASFFVELKLKGDRGMNSLRVKDHFVLCEWNQRAETIYAELRSDPRSAETPVVLLTTSVDSKPVGDDDFFFVHGEVTEDNLERINIGEASTVVILGDDSLEPGPRDAKVVLSVLTVEGIAPDVYSIVELVREENARHCERAHADEIIVADEFGSRLLASAAIDHGISRVISELLSARTGNDLQRIAVPAQLAGKRFLDVTTTLKDTQGSLALAVERGSEVVTNPAKDFRVEATDTLVVIADRSDRPS